jgi:UDP-2,3-diacylglucosamine hydrolase
MIEPVNQLSENKKIFFASDFHLGAPNVKDSLAREKKIVRWLNKIQQDAHAIYILGDIFDFWFEYKTAVPKGFVRLQGKLAELTDADIPITFFTGNHDMWMFDYFPKEFNIPVYRDPQILNVGDKKLFIGHGDGLGPGDGFYKFQKKVFQNKVAQWLFARLHPNAGISIATYFSRKSRIKNNKKEQALQPEKEWLYTFCEETEKISHHDFYVFGHRHLPLDLPVSASSRYINLGEWVNYYTYGEFDGKTFMLKTFEEDLK